MRLLLGEIKCSVTGWAARITERASERVTEQIKRGEKRRRTAYYAPFRLFSIWRNSAVCWPLYTDSSTETWAMCKAGRAGGGTAVFMTSDESGRRRGRVSEAEARLGGVMCAWLTIWLWTHEENDLKLHKHTICVIHSQCVSVWLSHQTHRVSAISSLRLSCCVIRFDVAAFWIILMLFQ